MIDTSCFIAAFRDRTGRASATVSAARGDQNEVFSRFVAMEILRGSSNDNDWARYEHYLAGQLYVDFKDEDYTHAARIFVDCRRAGFTPRSTIDCCIAQQAIRHDLTLLHDDNDYERIARVAPLRQVRVRLQTQKRKPT
jgi:predicted nucleic acid-binding protein